MAHWLSKRIQEQLKLFPVLIITGPRNSSRNTIVQQNISSFSSWATYNLEDPKQRREIEQDPSAWLSSQKQNVFLEEVQHIPMIFKIMSDHLKDPNTKDFKIIMTTSISPIGIPDLQKQLSGHYAQITLLDGRESDVVSKYSPLKLGRQKIIKIEDPLKIVFNGSSEGKPKTYYSKWLQNYIDRDLRNLRNVESLTDFQYFLEKLATLNGKALNMAGVAREINVSLNTVKAWITALSNSWIIHLVKPFNRDMKLKLKKSPYVYFYDSGLLCYLLGIQNKVELQKSQYLVEIVTCHVLNRLKNWFYKVGNSPPVFVWQPSNQNYPCLMVETFNRLSGFLFGVNAGRNSSEFKDAFLLKEVFQKKIHVNHMHLQDELEIFDNFIYSVPLDWAFSW